MNRCRSTGVVVAFVLLLAAPRPAAAQTSADTAAILSTVQSLFDAMLARDSVALASVVAREGMFAVVVVDGDSVTRSAFQPLAGFISSIGRPGPLLRERNWQPVVHIDGPFAAVWTPYDFHAGDEFSHCGTDVFLLARIGGAWRITGGSYTVQPEGCDPSPPGGP